MPSSCRPVIGLCCVTGRSPGDKKVFDGADGSGQGQVSFVVYLD